MADATRGNAHSSMRTVSQAVDQEEQKHNAGDFERQFQQLIDDLPDAYIEFDLKGRITTVNQAMVAMCSRPREELLGLSYEAFLEDETVHTIRRDYKGVCHSGLAQRVYMYEVHRKDGQRRLHEGTIRLKKENGQVIGFRGVWRDVTDRNKAEQALADHQRQTEAILGSVKEGIIAIDAHGIVTHANQAIETICGVSIGNIASKPFTESRMPCAKMCHALIRETLTAGSEITERQLACRRSDRPHQVIVFKSSPLIDASGHSMGAVIVLRDITEQLGMEKELKGRHRFQNIIGKNPKMQAIYDLLENLANLETTVLITGESGTGKELVSKALHCAGARSDRPFVKVNCSALSESLLESELFGHVKGAFTGAIKDRRGRFQTADGGTILLDEIGDISPLIQLKLLRVLQEKEFERVGESTSHKVNVRVIASTNKDLKKKVAQGEFREDLYYRLKVMTIPMPALRERLEDLPLLVDHFCKIFRTRFNKEIESVGSDVLRLLMNYRWPGNVRELEHALEHAFVLCNGKIIRPVHLPTEIREATGPAQKQARSNSKAQTNDAQAVINALEKTGWNKTKAAVLLGVNRRTIHRKIKQYRLPVKRGGETCPTCDISCDPPKHCPGSRDKC